MKRRTLLTLLLAGSAGAALARPRAATGSVLVLLELREGLIGRYPSLRELDGRGDLVPGISPPDLYRQVL